MACAGSLLASLAFLLIFAQPVLASFHLVRISEIYAGSAAHTQSSFVELQMYEADENLVHNHPLTLYGATGALVGTFTFPADLPGTGKSQQTMLVGDDGVQATFGVTPDLVDSGFNVPASGGAVCWDTLDCVSWGDFSGSIPSPSGVPTAAAGIPDGTSIARRISGGTCANLLEEVDDTDDSDSDFAGASPAPQSYATVPPTMSCVPPAPTPGVVIDTSPAQSTSSTAATFTFHSSPAGASLECRLDQTTFQACDSGAVTYDGPLAEAIHNFRVRASNANGFGMPAIHVWTVDLTAPLASITSHPADPSPGKSATFKYASNEGGSKFECKLIPIEVAFTPCSPPPKAYSNLANGDYEFAVRAIDAAGNVQSSPTVFPWKVNNSLLDTTPPETAILSKPSDPSPSPVASFTYSSSEPGSSFECKLDTGNFNSCPASGISYSGLPNGPHAFQVRAIDSSHNVDLTPAGYSFEVALAGSALANGAGPLPGRRTTRSSNPNTRIATQLIRTRDRTPTFRFASSPSGATFSCKVDGTAFKPCRSPFTTKTLSYGSHTLRVRAAMGGNADLSPAKLNFTVVKS